MRYAASILGLCLTFGCSGPSPPADGVGRPQSEPVAGLPDDEAAALCMAALQDLLKDSKDGDGTYVWVGGKDPSTGLLRRLQARWPGLRPASGMPADGYRADFTEVRRPRPSHADVRVVSYYRRPGNWMVFHLADKGGAWELVEFTSEIAP